MSFHLMINIILTNIKKIIIISFISTIFFAVLLYTVFPLTYSATVTLLPPAEQETGSLASLMAGGGELSGFLGLGGAQGNALLNAEILKSRSVNEEVIKKCNLLVILDAKDIHLAAEKLKNKISVNVTKEGLLSLSVELSTSYFGRFKSENDSIKNLIPRVANSFVEVLDQVNNEKMNVKAKNSRIYVEKQIAEIKDKLDTAEIKLKNFQNQYKAISIPEQLTAAIENAAKLKSEIVMTEIEINSMSYNLSSESQALQSLNKKLQVLNNQYRQFEDGNGENSDYLPAFSKVPDMIRIFAELTRDVKIYNEVYLFLQKQYFKEKIQESKDVSNVEVLDAAIVPYKASSPRLVFSTFFFGVFMFLLLATITIYKNKNLAS